MPPCLLAACRPVTLFLSIALLISACGGGSSGDDSSGPGDGPEVPEDPGPTPEPEPEPEPDPEPDPEPEPEPEPEPDPTPTPDPDPEPEPEPDTVLLEVQVTGGGNGSVTSVPAGIDCPVQCQVLLDATEDFVLSAEPDDASVFAGWDGPCTGQGADCTFDLVENVTITATFDPATPPVQAVGLPPEGALSIFQASGSTGGTIAAAMEEATVGDGAQGLWISGDRGETWQKRIDGEVSFVSISADAPQRILAAADNRIYLSQDGGASFPEVSAILGQFGDRITIADGQFGAGNNELWLAGGDPVAGGVYRSTDGGQNWSALLGGTGDAVAIDHIEVVGTTIYFGSFLDERFEISRDNGQSFQSIRAGLPNDRFLLQAGIAVAPSDAERVFVNGFGSENGGMQWTARDVNPAGTVWRGNDLLRVRSDGIYRSTDLGESFDKIVPFVDYIGPSPTLGRSIWAATDGLYIRNGNDIGFVAYEDLE